MAAAELPKPGPGDFIGHFNCNGGGVMFSSWYVRSIDWYTKLSVEGIIPFSFYRYPNSSPFAYFNLQSVIQI